MPHFQNWGKKPFWIRLGHQMCQSICSLSRLSVPPPKSANLFRVHSSSLYKPTGLESALHTPPDLVKPRLRLGCAMPEPIAFSRWDGKASAKWESPFCYWANELILQHVTTLSLARIVCRLWSSGFFIFFFEVASRHKMSAQFWLCWPIFLKSANLLSCSAKINACTNVGLIP